MVKLLDGCVKVLWEERSLRMKVEDASRETFLVLNYISLERRPDKTFDDWTHENVFHQLRQIWWEQAVCYNVFP